MALALFTVFGVPSSADVAASATPAVTDPVTATPSSLDFGEVQVGELSDYRSVMLSNNTGSDVGLSLAGTPAATAAVGWNSDCSVPAGGWVVPAGGTCNMNVQLSPKAVGPGVGQLEFDTDTDPVRRVAIDLTWTGLSALSVSPTVLDFGEVEIGEWSDPRTVTLQSLSTLSFALNPSDFGDVPARWAQPANCAIGFWDECHLSYQVKPDRTGPGEGTVPINVAFGDPSTIRYSSTVWVTLRWEGIPEIAPPTVNHLPTGGITLSLTDGRGYGALVWAFDPDDGLPTLMQMHIPGVVLRHTYWNYYWADMPRYTGVNRHEAMVFLAQLPPGEHNICFDAMDNQTGQWERIGCRTHVVK